MRYRGQSYEIETPITEAWIAGKDHRAIIDAFHVRLPEHGHADEKAEVQLVALRVVIAGRTPKPSFPERTVTPLDVAPDGTVTVAHRGGEIAAGLFRRRDLKARQPLRRARRDPQDDDDLGAARIQRFPVDGYGNLILSRERTS